MTLAMITSRTSFNESWLTEMPEGVGSFELFDMLEYRIKQLAASSSTVIDLGNNLKKIDGNQVKFYWYEKNGDIVLAIELSVSQQSLTVNATGKNPKYKGCPPFASDLYDAILKDTDRSIRIMSDTQLSDEGYDIWKRLFNQGHKISVYDRLNPTKTFHTFKNLSDLDNFFKKDDSDYSRYQFVLSESREMFAEMQSFFNTRRYRELAGLSLDDNCE